MVRLLEKIYSLEKELIKDIENKKIRKTNPPNIHTFFNDLESTIDNEVVNKLKTFNLLNITN